jgi:sulfate transport system ATP-binding protein
MSILLDRLAKHYAGHPVVQDVTLDVADGELFVLVGPSGSGKSTVLRMIAGLTPIDSGRVVLHGRDVTHESPQRRGVGFVFQHYALFRHMSVADNVAFALSVRRVPRAERRKRCDELLEMVGLAGLGDRLPRQLSGGQQQRVALARALAHNPSVLLLDEPFGALDAPIRADLRRAIRSVQRELRITTIFVTHDQQEAFELADRVGVMNRGRMLEVGPPEELYLRPETEFVATFLGTANLMVGERGADGVRLGPVAVPAAAEEGVAEGGRRVQVLFRPEDVALRTAAEETGWPLLGRGVVEAREFSGSFERLRLRIPRLPGVRPIAPPSPFGSDDLIVEAARSQHQARRFPLEVGDAAWIGIRRVHVLRHPGLSFLILTDGSLDADACALLGGQIAQLAHARVAIVAYGEGENPERLHGVLQRTRESLGGSLAAVETRSADGDAARAIAAETERSHFDLVVHGVPQQGRVAQAERLLRSCRENLLLVPPGGESAGPLAVPSNVLICVAVGEPGKDDVQFAARLVRHIRASATILTVLAGDHGAEEAAHAARFVEAGARSLALLGVPAATRIRTGAASEQIVEELAAASYDLLVVGAPLPDRRGYVTLGGLVADIIDQSNHRPVLIVRTRN